MILQETDRKPKRDREPSFSSVVPTPPSDFLIGQHLPHNGAWMAPRSTTNKAKAAGVGASSFLDLKAELAAKEKEIAENKGSGKKTTSGGQKPGKVSVSTV